MAPDRQHADPAAFSADATESGGRPSISAISAVADKQATPTARAAAATARAGSSRAAVTTSSPD